MDQRHTFHNLLMINRMWSSKRIKRSSCDECSDGEVSDRYHESSRVSRFAVSTSEKR